MRLIQWLVFGLFLLPVYVSFLVPGRASARRGIIALNVAESASKDEIGSFMEVMELPAGARSIALICSKIEEAKRQKEADVGLGDVSGSVQSTIVLKFLEWKRWDLLSSLLKKDRQEYIETVSFFSNTIPRGDLPNVQGVEYQYPIYSSSSSSSSQAQAKAIAATNTDSLSLSRQDQNQDQNQNQDQGKDQGKEKEKRGGLSIADAAFVSSSNQNQKNLENQKNQKEEKEEKVLQFTSTTSLSHDALSLTSQTSLTEDCTLTNATYSDSTVDKAFMGIFRNLVQQESGWASPLPGIKGLLDEGRHYMLSERGTAENQNAFVKRVLVRLMTPYLPPFYRLFMSGIVPCKENNDPIWLINTFHAANTALSADAAEKGEGILAPGKQIFGGPVFYAAFLTSAICPPLVKFMLGPSHTNLKKDGTVGGFVVEKCKFLQESGCKGLCLNQCKLPAQQFFNDTLKIPLTVEPNFQTQECQWSWGEVPPPPTEDPTWPKGCLDGCPSRSFIIESRS